MTSFEEGRYKARIIEQAFTESEKQTPGFVLYFRVLQSVDQPDAPVKGIQRDLTMWISDRTKDRVWRQLSKLGYNGNTFAGLNPKNPGFHDLSGVEIEVECKHERGMGEKNKDELFERWQFPQADKPPLTRMSALRRFDRGPSETPLPVGEAAAVGVSDDDVPF